jgi:hypothetical protein
VSVPVRSFVIELIVFEENIVFAVGDGREDGGGILDVEPVIEVAQPKAVLVIENIRRSVPIRTRTESALQL